MVRVLALRFIYNKKTTSPSPMGEDVSLTMALAISEGHKSKGSKLRSLSKLTLPFWIVQTSDTTSILLSAFGNRSSPIETSENTRLGEIRRIMSSEITSPDAIPDTVERIIDLLGDVKSSSESLKHLELPSYLDSVLPYIVDRELNIVPNRLKETLDSQSVLDISTNYQDLRDKQILRIESMENLKELINEKLQGHLKVLENKISLEKQQWEKRISALDERIQQRVQELGSKTSDELYSLKEHHRIEMRAVTADFSRAITEIEDFFNEIIEQIRKTRIAIHEKGEDVEGAIIVFNELVGYISEEAPKFEHVLNSIRGTSENVKMKYTQAQSGLEEMSADAKVAQSAQSAEYAKQKSDLESEREQKLEQLNALQEQVSNSVGKLLRIVNERITNLHQRLLELTSFNLENERIKNLAPLTRLDVDTYVATYDNDSFIIFTPCFMPEERMLSSYRHVPLDNEFDSYVTNTIETFISNTPGFEGAFENSCIEGNMLVNPDGLESIRSGLTKMQLTQLLDEGASEGLEVLWSSYSGQCPKCGAMAGVGSKFCPGCGATLSQ